MSSTGLMSCVRENSPQMEMAASESGVFSLPSSATSDSQKRRRFHPLRNLRRIFRRRTLSGADTISRIVSSSTSSPLSHISQTPLRFSESTAFPTTTTVSVSAHNSTCFSQDRRSVSPVDVTTMSSIATTGALFPPSQSQPISLIVHQDAGTCGLTTAVPGIFKITPSASSGFFVKNANVINTFACNRDSTSTSIAVAQDIKEIRDMMDNNHRSLSEGRLVDSECSKDNLSHSRDSVFSESATASSLSIGLQAELFDVLRKRCNRPDASEEDLGLPRSPITPQRKDHTTNQGEIPSLSLLSMASLEIDDDLSSPTNFNGGAIDKLAYSSFSSSGGRLSSSFDSSRNSDEIDLDISAGSRLSHSAARHKMAVRPKKKGPSRHRRPKEQPIALPSTPEVNEDGLKLSTADIKSLFTEKQKAKSHSLPPGVNAKTIQQHSTSSGENTSIKRSKTENTSASSICVIQTLRVESDLNVNSQASTLERNQDDEGSFFKRFLQRSSKKMKRPSHETDTVPENQQTEVCESAAVKSEQQKSTYSEEFKLEIAAGESSLQTSAEKLQSTDQVVQLHKIPKAKSGPAARQRVLPQNLSVQSLLPPPPEITVTDLLSSCSVNEMERNSTPLVEIKEKTGETIEKYSVLAKHSNSSDDTKITSDAASRQYENMLSVTQTYEHFEKHESRAQPKIVGLSPFQQKISRVESSTLDTKKLLPKQRKSVEKSKSFRYYDEIGSSDNTLKKRDNMPSLPDLTSSKVTVSSDDGGSYSVETEPKSVSSMGFEINDNNLIKVRKYNEPLAPALQESIFTNNIMLSPSKPISQTCMKNINEIEENIDKLVKSPFVTVFNSEELSDVKSNVHKSRTNIQKLGTREAVKTGLRFADRVKSASSEILNRPDTKYESDTFAQKIYGTESKDRKFILEFIESKSDGKSKERNIASISIKPRRSSAYFESRPTSESEDIPEFMKIQLNRVDSSRPKSNLVLSKNAKLPDFEDWGDLTRRFSNESVEITDTKPPLPPDASTSIISSNSYGRAGASGLAKSQEDLNNQPVNSTTVKKYEASLLKSPVKKVDEENNYLKNTESVATSSNIETHREGKPKYIKKNEEQKAEKRKSVIESSREAIEKETGVILRKKSFSANNQNVNNKEDTPELIKVFARRSLKIKDSDETPITEDTERTTLQKREGYVDSDKENQSSNEEKLDKLPKIEITIKPKPAVQNGQLAINQEDKVRSDLFRKPNTAAFIHSTTPKPFIQPIRYSSVTTYRSISNTFVEKMKDASVSQFVTSTSPYVSSSCTSDGSTISSEQMRAADVNEANNNSNVTDCSDSTIINNRHTIGSSNPATITSVSQEESSEFKGILQRRAEWEKRAKEALK